MSTAQKLITTNLKRLPRVTFTLILFNLFIYSVWPQSTVIDCIDCGLYTGKWIGLTLVSHMFVHAGLLHLFSNLIFLALLGYMTEKLLGPSLFLGLYLGSGLAVTAIALLFFPDIVIPGFGTSGATSGVLGLSAVLFGHRQITLIQLSGRFTNVQSMPVFGLLPLWISIEFIQFMVYSSSQVNYLLHIFGLLLGAVLALLLKRAQWVSSMNLLNETPNCLDAGEELTRAREYLNQKAFKEALSVLRQLYRDDCRTREFLSVYYQSAKAYPERKDVHRAARAIFSLSERDAKTVDLIIQTYRDYVMLAEPGPRFNERVLYQLADLFVQRELCSEVDKIMLLMRKRGAACLFDSNLPYRYAKLLDRQGRTSESLEYLRSIN
jgi:membrane associated rhomboid family serine protease